MSNQLSSYDAEVSQHMQSKDAREFFANSMVALNVYVGADINKELPEALETQIRRIESIQVSPICTFGPRPFTDKWAV